jgi:hypothetical protein
MITTLPSAVSNCRLADRVGVIGDIERLQRIRVPPDPVYGLYVKVTPGWGSTVVGHNLYCHGHPLPLHGLILGVS